MTKLAFLSALHERLRGLPREDVEERVGFYAEMIEDRVEEGLSEEDAVAAVGSVDEIAAQIAAEIPAKKAEEKPRRAKKRPNGWVVALLVLGSPVWLSLAIAAAAVVFSLYVSVWAVMVSLWSAVPALACGAFAGVALGVGYAFGGATFIGLAALAAGFVCAGLAVLWFLGCLTATKGVLKLTKKLAGGVKIRRAEKEDA